MTQGCPAFAPDTIHIKLSSIVQTAGQARSAWENTPPKNRPVGCGVSISRRFRNRSITTRNTSRISWTRSFRTLPDRSFEGRLSRLFVPGYHRLGPPGQDVCFASTRTQIARSYENIGCRSYITLLGVTIPTAERKVTSLHRAISNFRPPALFDAQKRLNFYFSKPM